MLTKSLMKALPPEGTSPEAGPFRIHDLAAGTWGWEEPGLTCQENPHTFVFSDDLTRVTLRYSKGVGGEPPLEVGYTVLGEGKGYLRMRKDGETEKASDGSPVLWDWVLLSGDKYCWHRTDWREGGCTKPIVRCTSGGHAKQTP